MFDFTIHIATNEHGKISKVQQKQLQLLIGALTDRRIKLRWIVPDEFISVMHLCRLLRIVHSCCRKKGVLVQNELVIDGKEIPQSSRILLKFLPIHTYSEESTMQSDLACLQNGNLPLGCSFCSCLGKTLFLMRNGSLSICPHMHEVYLNPMQEAKPINYVFDTDEFKTCLLRQIQKRKRCKTQCSLYDLCRGGCPEITEEQ